MKSTAIVCAIAAASLGFSALSFAQGHDRRGAREELPRVEQRDSRHFDQRDQTRYERHDGRREERSFEHRNDRRFYYNARSPDFRRGGYIPREFRNRQYFVADYRAHRLSPPPRGQQWVQVGPDYVLIAIATGLIAHMVLSQ